MLSVFAIYASTADLGYESSAELGGISNDAHSASVGAWRVATTAAPWLDDVDLAEVKAPKVYLWIGKAPNGHTVVFRSPGVIAVGIPAYWLKHVVSGTKEFSLMPGAMTAALLASLGCLLFFLTLRGLISTASALLSAAALAFATPMWTVAGNSLWTHPLTTAGILGMAWAARGERWWLVGLFGGVGLWGRLHVAVVVAILGLGIAMLRREPRIALIVGGVSGVFLGLASVWSHWTYGSWSPTGGYSGAGYLSNLDDGAADGTWDQIANHLGMWIAPDRGMLVWTPVLLLLLPAVVRSWRDLPDWSRCLTVGGLAYIGIQGQLNLFTGGDGYYGYRLQLELLACVAPAYALSASRVGTRGRQLLGPLLALQFAAMAVGATSEGFYVFKENAWTDNSLALALRTFPLLAGWLLLMAVVGFLATRVWEERNAHSRTPALQE